MSKYSKIREIEDQIKSFFEEDDHSPNYGDRGYQRLLEKRDELLDEEE